ncbi:MAG: 30S ribosomal protein S6 [Actinobacteria bacterium]|nr:30S ribosomal protein S6 [Actinomycetota bacterium]
MAAPREYELVLMLDPQQDAPARDALAQQARGQIESAGSLKQENTWGLRKMAYEINRRTEADYRWFRFKATNDLLESLDHELKIADGVLRFRIFKVDANTPTLVPPAVAAPGPRERTDGPRDRGDRGPRGEGPRDEAPVESEPEPAAAAEPAGE